MKQIAWIYVVLVGLAVAFSAVSLAIYFMGPRPVLISKKLKFGALIISFNTLLAGCYASKDAKESITCYGPSPDTNCDAANTDTAAKSTDGLPVDTDVECYVSPPPDDTGTAVPSTDIGVVETDIECYDPVEETDVACYDTDSPPIETDTGDPSIETDVMCYEAPIETDIECYDAPEEYPSDSETLISDAGPDDTDTGEPVETDAGSTDTDTIETDTGEPPVMCYESPFETDIECYDVPDENWDPDGGIDD